MAHFHILHEVKHDFGKPNDWQLCFQYGIYVYDQDQNTHVPKEEGYRFIWRRPNGQLQGARGQARLMPDWISLLIGKATIAGWYPHPPAPKNNATPPQKQTP